MARRRGPRGIQHLFRSRPGYLRFFLDYEGNPVVEFKEYATVAGEQWRRPRGHGPAGRVFSTLPNPEGPCIVRAKWEEPRADAVNSLLRQATARERWSADATRHWQHLQRRGTLPFTDVQPARPGEFGQSAKLEVDGESVAVRLIRDLPRGRAMWHLPASASTAHYLPRSDPTDASNGIVGPPESHVDDSQEYEVDYVVKHRTVQVCCRNRSYGRSLLHLFDARRDSPNG